MAKVILHTDPESGMLFITHPSGVLSVDETAKKDVPTGVEYWIVDDFEIPTDRSFRDAWEIDTTFLGPSSGVGE